MRLRCFSSCWNALRLIASLSLSFNFKISAGMALLFHLLPALLKVLLQTQTGRQKLQGIVGKRNQFVKRRRPDLNPLPCRRMDSVVPDANHAVPDRHRDLEVQGVAVRHQAVKIKNIPRLDQPQFLPHIQERVQMSLRHPGVKPAEDAHQRSRLFDPHILPLVHRGKNRHCGPICRRAGSDRPFQPLIPTLHPMDVLASPLTGAHWPGKSPGSGTDLMVKPFEVEFEESLSVHFEEGAFFLKDQGSAIGMNPKPRQKILCAGHHAPERDKELPDFLGGKALLAERLDHPELDHAGKIIIAAASRFARGADQVRLIPVLDLPGREPDDLQKIPPCEILRLPCFFLHGQFSCKETKTAAIRRFLFYFADVAGSVIRVLVLSSEKCETGQASLNSARLPFFSLNSSAVGSASFFSLMTGQPLASRAFTSTYSFWSSGRLSSE